MVNRYMCKNMGVAISGEMGEEGGPRCRRYMDIYITDSLHCTAETNTTL